MKKALLATTALATAAILSTAPVQAAEEGVNVSMWSVFTASAGGADNFVSADRTGHDFATNTEITFTASTEMDNGITVGMMVQVEADASENRKIAGVASAGGTGDTDENHISFSGSFGEILLGNQDGAGDGGITGTNVGVNYGGIGNPTGTIVSTLRYAATPAGGSNSNTTGPWLRADGGDDSKITYFTPTFNGFSAGISYTPTGGTYFKAWGGGLSYSGEFDGVTFSAALRGVHANRVAQSHIDADGWKIGAMLSYMNFSISGGYANQDDEGLASGGATVGTDDNAFSIGVGYANGPVSIALAGMWAEEDVANDDLTEYSLSLSYDLGSGVGVFVSGLIGESDLNTVGGGGETDYEMVTIGTAVSF